MTQQPPSGLPERPDRAGKLLRAAIVAGVVIAALVYGWQVTEIDLSKLTSPPANLRVMINDFLHPDVFSREQQRTRLYRPFVVPCDSELTPGAGMGQGLTVTPDCGSAGDEVLVELTGARPDTGGRLNWRFPQGGAELVTPIRTDAAGNYRTAIQVPKAPLGREEGQHGVEIILEWEEGPLRLSETTRVVIQRMIETVFLALMATVFGVLIAFPISFLAARNIMATNPIGSAIYVATRFILNVIRSVEVLIWALIFIVWVGIGPFAGVLALTIHSASSLAKLYSEAVEEIDPGPVEAVRATGAGRLQTVLYAVIPQVVPQFISFTIYRWDINVRMSTVVGMVGGGGIGFLLVQWINLLQYQQAAVAVYAIIIVVSVMDYFSGWLREKIK